MLQINKLSQMTGHNSGIYALIAAQEANHFLSGAGDGWIVDWDLASPELGELIAKIEIQIFSLCQLKGGKYIVAGNMNGGVHWIDLRRPEHAKNIAHHRKGVFGLLEVGPHLFSIGGAGLLSKWSIGEARSLESLQLSHAALRCIAYAPLRNELAIGSSDHNIYVLDAASLELKQVYEAAHENSVFALAYHPNQQLLLSGGRDAHLKAWNLEGDHACVADQSAHWFTINDIVFHPEGHLFATASRDKTIRIWDAQNFQLLKSIEAVRDAGHVNSVNRLLWTKQGLLSASDDRRVILWEIQTE